MANGVSLDTIAGFRESSVSTVEISLMEAAAAFEQTAAPLMAAHSGVSSQKVMYIPPVTTPGALVATAAGENLKPALTSKAGVSFVIPKNKLSGALVPVIRNVAAKWEPNDVKKDEEVKLLPQRKTRWGIDLTQDPVVRSGRALALQTRAEQIAAQLESGQLDIDNSEGIRSPSPPPIYDSNGQRTNTKEGRRREQLELERREAIGECLQLNPAYKPPAGYKPVYKEAKLYIPVKDYPGYNFIGLILGPRGNTQKRMEAETGSKIAIRGKGAIKEGKGGRRDGKEAEGAFEDLHVHITADSIEKVDAAVALIEPLLTPVDVCCLTCGDGSHPTFDCPMKHTGQGKVLDKEYLSFLEELGDGLAGTNTGSTLGLSKVAAEVNTKEESEAVLLSATTTGPSELTSSLISETSLDPNQLADVISRPQPMLITAAGPQPMPPAWTSVGMFPSGFEARMGPQQGGFGQGEGERQFHDLPNGSGSPMHPPGTNSFNVYLSPLKSPTYPLALGGTLVFHGQPPPAGGQPGQRSIQLNGFSPIDPGSIGNKDGRPGFLSFPMLPAVGPVGTGPNVLNSSFQGTLQTQSSNEVSLITTHVNASMQSPCTTARPPVVTAWAPPPPSNGSIISCNQNVMAQQTGAVNVRMQWDSPHPHPPPGPPQPPPTTWQCPSGPAWVCGPSSRSAPASCQLSWEVKQRPWEVTLPPFSSQVLAVTPQTAPAVAPPNPSWNPSPPPMPPANQTWKIPQPHNFLQCLPKDSFPSSGGVPLWRGPPPSHGPPLSHGPPPSPVAMPNPKPPIPPQSPQILTPSHTRQASPPLFPPWYPHQAQQNPKPGTYTNFRSPNPQMVPLSGTLLSTPSPAAIWGKHSGGDPRPQLPMGSLSERGGNQAESYDSFTPIAVAPHTLNNSNVHHQKVGGPMHGMSAPSGVCSFPVPNTGWNQPGFSVGNQPWHGTQLGPILRLAPTPSLPPLSPPKAPEVDAEYEKLMASVGVK